MIHVRKMMAAFLGIFCSTMLWNTQQLSSQAADTDVAGYHEYTTTEDEAIDHWYGVARGTYLKEAISGLKKAGTGKMSVSGTTTAYSTCDWVKVGIYLDESSDGGSSYNTIGIYHFEKQNTTICHGSEGSISVTVGLKYHVRGVHSVIEGSTDETTSTSTKVLTAS